MPDITMCKDGACPSRQQCLRFMADPSDNQFYMVSDRTLLTSSGSGRLPFAHVPNVDELYFRLILLFSHAAASTYVSKPL